MYDIQSRSDFQTGATLVVRVPEVEVDYAALYTIQSEQPEFLVPFRYCRIDDEVEFTYIIGKNSKLSYHGGVRNGEEYCRMWINLLQPLIDCSDWFLSPEFFVFSMEYLYYDVSTSTPRFVYIPSAVPTSSSAQLQKLVKEVAETQKTNDIALERKILYGLLDFQLAAFLQIVKTYTESKAIPQSAAPEMKNKNTVVQPVLAAASTPAGHPTSSPESVKVAKQIKTSNPVVVPIQSKLDDDLVIDFSEAKAPKTAKGRKESKAPKEEKAKFSLFGKKKEKQNKPMEEMFAEVHGIPVSAARPAVGISSYPAHSADYPALAYQDDCNEATQIEDVSTKTGLRYVGMGSHPSTIEVSNSVGNIFSIGRFDASVGVKQSHFEFPKNTKAVSRHHALIEHKEDGYYLVDIGSAAGTFLDGQKLPINAPFRIVRGQRISFGNSGADYIWEEM